MKIREFFVKLGVETDEEKLKSFDDAVDNVKDGLQDLANAAKLVGVQVAALGGFLGMTAVKTAEYAEEVTRSAAALGGTIEDYQKYRFAFRQLGASTDDLMDAFATMTDRAQDAIEGSKTYAKEFTRIGIAVRDLKGKKPIELFEMYTKAAAKAANVNQAVTSAVRLFGDDLGRRILPALLSTSESFERFLELATQTQSILGKDQIATSRDAQLSFRLLKSAISSVWRELGSELAPLLKDVTRLFSDLIIENRQWISVGIQRFVVGFTEQVNALIVKGRNLVDMFGGGTRGLTRIFKAVAAAINLVVVALVGLAAVKIGGALAAVGIAGLIAFAKVAAVVMAVGAAIAILVGVIQELIVFFQGGDTILGRLIADGGALSEVLSVAAEFVRELFNVLGDAFEFAKDQFAALGEKLGGKGTLKKLLKFIYILILGVVGVVVLWVTMWVVLIGLVAALAGAIIWLVATVVETVWEIAKAFWKVFEFFVGGAMDVFGWFVEQISLLGITIYDTLAAEFDRLFDYITQGFEDSISEGLTRLFESPLGSYINPAAGLGGTLSILTREAGSRASDEAGARAAGAVGGRGAVSNQASVNIEKVEIASSDPEGVTREMGDGLGTQLRLAWASFGSGEV